MERLHLRCQAFLLAVLCSGMLLGCGSGSRLVPVEGIVTLNGDPLPEATVSLQPETAADPGPFAGVTDEAGKYALSPSDNPSKNGVVPGTYRLVISTLKTAPTDPTDDAAIPQVITPEKVPDQYRTGIMRFEVPEEGNSEANFDIRRRR